MPSSARHAPSMAVRFAIAVALFVTSITSPFARVSAGS